MLTILLLIIAIVGIVLMYVGLHTFMVYGNRNSYFYNRLLFYLHGYKTIKRSVSMLREDIRGICHKPCLYNDNGKCDMWDETEKCDNQIDV